MGNEKVLAESLTQLVHPSSSAEETVSIRLQNTQRAAIDTNYLALQIMQMTFKHRSCKSSFALAKDWGYLTLKPKKKDTSLSGISRNLLVAFEAKPILLGR